MSQSRVVPAGTGPVDLLHLAYGGLGGHNAVIAPLSSHLRGRGIRSAVVTYAPDDELRANAGAWDDLDIVLPVPLGGLLDVEAFRRVAWITAALRPRVVLCHTHKLVPSAFVGMVGRLRAPRLVLAEHQAIDLRSRRDDISSALALPLVRSVVVNQHDYARRYPLRRLPLPALRHLSVVPNGVDTTFFTPPATPAPVRREVVLGMATRITPTKDLATLVRAVGVLQTVGLDRPVRLEIAGDGPERRRLEQLVHDLRLERHVTFLGALDRPALLEFLRRLDVYVQSTLGETACTAVLQAFAVARPVVATDVAGVRELVRHGTDGLLVAPGDHVALADAISTLVRHADKAAALGASGRARAVAEFDAVRTTASYCDALHAVDPKGPWLAARR